MQQLPGRISFLNCYETPEFEILSLLHKNHENQTCLGEVRYRRNVMRILEPRHAAFSFVPHSAVMHAKPGAKLAAFTLVLLTSLAVGLTPAEAARCASLASLSLKDTTITA